MLTHILSSLSTRLWWPGLACVGHCGDNSRRTASVGCSAPHSNQVHHHLLGMCVYVCVCVHVYAYVRMCVHACICMYILITGVASLQVVLKRLFRVAS